MKRVGRKSTTLFAVALFALATGCLSSVELEPGLAEPAFLAGALEAELEARPHEVARAAQQALGERDLPVLWLSWTSTAGRVDSCSADGRPIRIAIRSVSEGVSHVSLRLGPQGDAAQSHALLEAIRRHL